MLRAVDGIDCEAKLESEAPIPVVLELSSSLLGDGDLCRIVACRLGATNTTPGALFTLGTLPGATAIDPCLDMGMQPAATVKEAPLEMCGGDSISWLCNPSKPRARAEDIGAAGNAAAGCGGRAIARIVACVETDEPMEAHDRESGALPEGMRLPTATGVGVL